MALRARPTIYNGIRMRSRLEAGFAAWLDEAKLSWAYEPECFAGPAGQYLPDFRIDNLTIVGIADDVTAYVEVKPETWPEATDPRDTILNRTRLRLIWPMLIWQSNPRAAFLLLQPGHTHVPVATYGGPDAPANWLSATWVFADDNNRAGLAIPYPRPWPDGYWQAT